MPTPTSIDVNDPVASDIGCMIGGALAILLLVALVVALMELLRWRTIGVEARHPLLPLVAGDDADEIGLHKGVLWVTWTD